MYCPNCGFEVSSDQQFCPNCGKFLSKGGTTPPVTNPYSSVTVRTNSMERNNYIWQGFLVFFSMGWLVIAIDFLPQVWGWNFGFDFDTRFFRFGLLIFWLGATLAAKFLAKFPNNKVKMLIGYALILLGLAFEFFSPSVILAIAIFLPIFAGAILVLSSLSKQEPSAPWIYLVGGTLGAMILSFLLGPIFENFGPRMILIITFFIIMICMITLVFVYPKDDPTNKIYSNKQWAFMIGTIGGVYLLLVIIGIVSRLIRGWPIF